MGVCGAYMLYSCSVNLQSPGALVKEVAISNVELMSNSSGLTARSRQGSEMSGRAGAIRLLPMMHLGAKYQNIGPRATYL